MKQFYVLLFSFFLLVSIGLSQVPEKISYQGLVTDSNGSPVSDGNHEFTFSLYSSETGGTALWSETRTVEVKSGVLNVILGENNPINIDLTSTVYLGISIDGGTELSPRIEFTSVPYALRAKTVEKDAIGSFQIADKSIFPRKINTDGALQGQVLKFNGDTLEWSNDLVGSGGGSGFSLPYKETVNFPDNAFWIIHQGGGSVAKFDIENIGSGGHALEATSKGQTSTIFIKNTNQIENTANAIYGLSEGIASTSRFVNSSTGAAGEFENTGTGVAALFKKEGTVAGESVVKIYDNGPYEHSLLVIDSAGGGSSVKILQPSDINLKPTLEVEGGHQKYSPLATFKETGIGSGINLEISDQDNKWEAQKIIHNGKGTGLYINTKNVEENLETSQKEASLSIETDTKSSSPIVSLVNTSNEFTGDGINLNHSGKGNGIKINKSNSGYSLNITHNSDTTAVVIEQFNDYESGLYVSAKPGGENASIKAKAVGTGAAIRGEGTLYGGYFSNRTNSENGAAIFVRTEGLNSNAIQVNNGDIVLDSGQIWIGSGNYLGDDISIGGDIMTGGRVISFSSLEGNSLYITTIGSVGGDFSVGGTLTKAGGSFKIDHPLDPQNKYLYHSFVESPDMKNIYDGVVVLDNTGSAEVILPEWFEALNKDFRYQLTCIGGFANVYISQEIRNNRFKISGGFEGLKVSWQITGIRKDPWAEKHRIPVEEEKPDDEKGSYLHPDVYPQSK